MKENKPIILGIIVEFNPYHNGHQHFIKQAINKVNPDIVVAITSTSFTMRGEVAIVNKFQKTKLMLDSGIDLVVELPYIMGTQSADYFAYHSVMILNQFNITHIAFGIEDRSLHQLYYLKSIIDSFSFKQELADKLAKKTSYKRAFTAALQELHVDDKLIKLFNQPNATLAIQYVNALEQINNKIEVINIERIGSGYHDLNTSTTFGSAKAIRHLLYQNQDVSTLLPFPVSYYHFIDQERAENNLLSLIKYQLYVEENDFKNLFGFTEGIENYLIKNTESILTYRELINNLKNKRYSISRIERLFTYLLLKVPKNISFDNNYLRVLGFNQTGENYLSQLPKQIKQSLITSFKRVKHPLGKLELKATKLYGLLTDQPQLYLEEFKIPYRKDFL